MGIGHRLALRNLKWFKFFICFIIYLTQSQKIKNLYPCRHLLCVKPDTSDYLNQLFWWLWAGFSAVINFTNSVPACLKRANLTCEKAWNQCCGQAAAKSTINSNYAKIKKKVPAKLNITHKETAVFQIVQVIKKKMLLTFQIQTFSCIWSANQNKKRW